MTQKLPHICTANHATFPIQIRKITVQICGNFWVTQYYVVIAPWIEPPRICIAARSDTLTTELNQRTLKYALNYSSLKFNNVLVSPRLEKYIIDQFSSVSIFRETKYANTNTYITCNHNSRILRRAFDPGFTGLITFVFCQCTEKKLYNKELINILLVDFHFIIGHRFIKDY